MLQLLLMIPTEQIIISRENLVSTLNHLEHIKIQTRRGMPEKFPAILPWKLLVLWRRTVESAEQLTFEQKIELVSTDGRVDLTRELSFKLLPQHVNVRTIAEFKSFPIYKTGVVWVCVYFRQKLLDTAELPWQTAGKFPLNVTREIVETIA